MDKILILVTGSIFFFNSSFVYSQSKTFQFQHLSVENGLSDNNVLSITQDKAGFIWIGTSDGLNLYDGSEVEVFHHRMDDVNSLPDNNVRTLFTDSRGTVWIGTINGLASYEPVSHAFHIYRSIANNENSLSENWITAITESDDGMLWIGTTNGLCSFDVHRQQFHRYIHSSSSNSISANYVHGICFTGDSLMWIATANGLNSLDVRSKKFTGYFFYERSDSTLRENNLQNISPDRDGNLWLSSWNASALEYFNIHTHQIKPCFNFELDEPGLSNNYIRSIFIDNKDRLWVGMNTDGLKLYDPAHQNFITYHHDRSDANSIGANTSVCFYQDHSGMIWMGTGIAGADRFNPDETKFGHYHPEYAQQPTLADGWVRCIAEDAKQHLWIGTLKGISILNRSTGSYINYQWNRNDKNSLSNNSVRSLCRDVYGNMWVGTAEGLNLFDEKGHRFRRFLARENEGLCGNFINCLMAHDNGDVWIGTGSGLTIYHAATKGFFNFKNDPGHSLFNSPVRIIFRDQGGIIWIGTQGNGLLRYIPSTGEVRQFLKSADSKNSIVNHIVFSIAQDQEGIVWIGTQTGLYSVNEREGSLKWYGEKDGLPNEHIAELKVDDHDRIWMSSNKGISMLNKERTAFTNYDESDGLQGLEFNDQSACTTHDGYFCYSGFNGFNIFHPDSIRSSTYKPQVVIHSFSIFDTPRNLDSILFENHAVHLQYSENFFSFHVAALSYDHPEKNQYAYQLNGFDEKFNYTRSGVIRYTNVPPGNYTLKVIASNNDGVWNKDGMTLRLSILPPFWQTWWFYLLCFAGISAMLYAFYRLRMNRMVAIQRVRTQISRDLHDEIGASLSSVHLMSSFAGQSLDESSGDAKQWMDKIGNSTKEMMEKIRDIVWTLNSSNEISGSLTTRMKQFASQLLEPKEIEFYFNEEEQAMEAVSDFIHKRNVYLIFKEAVNNAAKYSGCSSLKIDLMIADAKFKMVIEDNGIGFDISTIASGNGLRNMKHRAVQIRGELTVQSKPGKGTCVTLFLPVPRWWYRIIKPAE